METNNLDSKMPTQSSRIWSGLVLLIAGALLLAYKMGAPIPSWLFTWPMILITVGFFIGLQSKFQNPGAFILLAIGGIFLADKLDPDMNLRNFIVPIILIAIGLFYIIKPNRRRHCNFPEEWRKKKSERFGYVEEPSPSSYQSSSTNTSQTSNTSAMDNAEYVEINAIFGGVKRNIFSKNFKGGEINSFMGGTEINLSHADMQEPTVLEVNNIFGGTKLIVPSNWYLKNEVTTVFGGIEDKRNMSGGPIDTSKVMVLKGSCVFGGIEISNY